MPVWLVVVLVLVASWVCWLVGRRQRYAEGVEQGRRLTLLEHDWRPLPPLPGSRRRRWLLVDRKAVPEPMVTTGFTAADRPR